MATLRQLKEQVCEANLDLAEHGLVVLTWGNVSGVDRDRGVMAIKPSGVAYDELTPSKIAVVRLTDGQPAGTGGDVRPSSDTPTHLELYRAFPEIGGVAHTHCPAATGFAQAGRAIPCLGTTHADHFHGPVPLTRWLTRAEIDVDYETATGKAIVETFRRRSYLDCPAVLAVGHGPFTWGRDARDALENGIALEAIAAMAALTLALSPGVKVLPAALRDKHYSRKHGPAAYYGQKKS